jgi:hypothetical protein
MRDGGAAVTWFLLSSGMAFLVCGLAVQLTVPRHRRLGYLLSAGAQAVFALSDFLDRLPSGALNAACCAWYLWLWWHSGGGDGTKRRLRRLRTRFTGVRRTAPATAMAVAL